MFKILCNHATCKIRGDIPVRLKKAIWEKCSYELAGAEYLPKVRQGRWDGKKRLFHRRWLTFPAGLLQRVTDVLDMFKAEYRLEWEVEEVRPQDSFPIYTDMEARPYQVEAVRAALDARRGILRVATGGGKTFIATLISARLGLPVVFLVHTKDLLYQARQFFIDALGEDAVGQIGDGVIEPADVTICTLQTAARALGVEYETYDEDDTWLDEETDPELVIDNIVIKRVLHGAGVVFMDECHRVAAPTAMEVMAKIDRAPYRIGLSASPWRDDGADLAIEAALGPVLYAISASELHDMGFLVAPVIRMLDVPPRHFGKKRYDTVYREYIVENEERNLMGVEAAVALVRRGLPTMLLVRHIRHGEAVRRLISERLDTWVPFLSGSDSSSTRNTVLEEMRDGHLPALVATTIADEGLDLRPLSGLVLLGGGKSSVRALQRIGRTLRTHPGKSHAEVIDFEDQARYLVKHSAARRQIYGSEEAWAVTDI